MNNLTNKPFTNVAALAQIPSLITKVADKLLNGLVPHEDVSAAVCVKSCSECFGGGTTRVRYCTITCCEGTLCAIARYRYYC